MKLPFAGFWRGLIEELRFESSNIDQVDTIWRWLGLMVFFIAVYLSIYHYEEFWIWISQVTSYEYTPTLPRKVMWHKLTFGWLCGLGIFVMTFNYGVHVVRRIRARIEENKKARYEAQIKQ